MAEISANAGSRLVRWGYLIGILVVLLVIYGLCVPYRTSTAFMDRRTGAWFGYVSYFGIPVGQHRQISRPIRGDPLTKGPLTAPERRILVRTISQRFFWSQSVMVYDDVGVQYAEAFFQMFYFASWELPKAKKLTDDEVDRIIKSRIPFWNSRELDNDPRLIAEAARQENSDLLGVPVGVAFRP